ncbi:hypothetical protein [Kribbella sp.]|uniref:hypothetical protein n=1 Tax=Kribbella sp. TaxID=1871183 RepID=UPI002D2A11DF|nr:hypothetical protein [Kribbella sp.]HZX03700.1 hypothetical protein [Kribbella sp.]
MSERTDAGAAPQENTVADRRRGIKIVGAVLAGVLILMLIVLPWLETWGYPRTQPEHVYRGLQLITPLKTAPSDVPFLNGAAPGMVVGYLVLAAACLFFPATVIAVVSGFAGFALTIALLLSVTTDVGHHPSATWTYSPVVAIAIWLVTAMVSTVGWTSRRAV